jgi:hypothetical protein
VPRRDREVGEHAEPTGVITHRVMLCTWEVHRRQSPAFHEGSRREQGATHHPMRDASQIRPIPRPLATAAMSDDLVDVPRVVDCLEHGPVGQQVGGDLDHLNACLVSRVEQELAGPGEAPALRGVVGVEDPAGVVVVVDQNDSRHAPSTVDVINDAISLTMCLRGTTSTGAVPRDSSTSRMDR